MKVLRSGGEYLEAREWWSWTALSLVGLALLITAMVGLSVGGWPVAIAAGALVLAAAKGVVAKIIRRLRATRKGRLGEGLTSQLIARLPDDYYLINDVAAQHGNIDHVVVGPCGILVIETKRVAGEIACDGDRWSVKGRPVRSWSKQAKAGAVAVKTLLRTRCEELREEYVKAAVVLVDPRCRVKVNRATVAVVRFSELLPLIMSLGSTLRMQPALARLAASALSGNRPTSLVRARTSL